MNKYKYTVSKISLPECVTGSVEDIEAFSDLDSAVDKCEELNKLDNPENPTWFEVIVDKLKDYNPKD